MAFSIPSLNDLVRVAENGLLASFGFESGSTLRKSVLKVLARVFAGTAYLVVLLLGKMWKNVFLTTCDVETLVENGANFDLPNKPESYARGQVVVKSTDVAAVIRQGTILVANGDVEYEVVSDVTLSGGADGTLVNVMAVAPGESSDVDAGTALVYRDGVPENVVDDTVVAPGGLMGGRSIEVIVNGNTEYWGETVEAYRTRLLDYRRNPPSGGNDADYKGWAERFSSVDKCIPFANYPSSGCVRCVLAHFSESSDHVAVNSTNVDEVSEYICSDVRRPITANVAVVSCTEKTVDAYIGVSPNTAESQTSVRAALKEVFRSYEPGDTITLQDLNTKLSLAANVDRLAVAQLNGAESVTLDKSTNEMPVVGVVVWDSL